LTPRQFTWRAWVRLLSYPASLGIVFGNYGGNAQGWYVAVRSDGRPLFCTSRLPGQSYWVVSPQTLQLGRWHRLAVTWEGPSQQARLSVDGRVVAEAVTAGLTPHDRGFATMGRSSWHDGYFLELDLDEVNIEPRALTPGEISQDFAAWGRQ
jgi:hypothetical protein